LVIIKKEPGKKCGEKFLLSIKRCGKINNMLHIIIWNKTVVYFELNLMVIPLVCTKLTMIIFANKLCRQDGYLFLQPH